jgi:hypothetical protein
MTGFERGEVMQQVDRAIELILQIGSAGYSGG